MAVVTFINIFFEGGINIHTVRQLTSNPSEYTDYFPRSFTLKILGGLFTAFSTIIFLLFTHYESTIVYLTLISIVFIIFNGLLIHMRSFFRAFEIMKYEAYSIVFEKVTLILLCGTVLFITQNVVLFTSFYSLSSVITFTYTFLLVLRTIGKPKYKFGFKKWITDILKPAFPFAIMNILIIGRSRAGTLLLKFISKNDEWVGYYNAGYRLLDSFMLFPNMIETPLLPVFVRFQTRKSSIRRLLNGGYHNILAISAIVAFPIFILHRTITLLLFGPTFEKASLAVGIIALNMIPAGLTTIMGNLVAATGRQPLVNKLFIFETITTVILHTIFISLYGYVGATVASLIGDTIYLSINMWVTRDYVLKSGFLPLIGKIILVLGFLISIKLSPIFPESAIAQLLLILIFNFVALYVLGIIRHKEISDFKKMVHSIIYKS